MAPSAGLDGMQREGVCVCAPSSSSCASCGVQSAAYPVPLPRGGHEGSLKLCASGHAWAPPAGRQRHGGGGGGAPRGAPHRRGGSRHPRNRGLHHSAVSRGWLPSGLLLPCFPCLCCCKDACMRADLLCACPDPLPQPNCLRACLHLLPPARVHRKPHVAVLSTGDEVCEPDAPRLELGQIRWGAAMCGMHGMRPVCVSVREAQMRIRGACGVHALARRGVQWHAIFCTHVQGRQPRDAAGSGGRHGRQGGRAGAGCSAL